jgi:hypothetical protein
MKKIETISLQLNGSEITGTYFQHENMITVDFDGRTKTTQLGALTAERLARMLLSELARRL